MDASPGARRAKSAAELSSGLGAGHALTRHGRIGASVCQRPSPGRTRPARQSLHFSRASPWPNEECGIQGPCRGRTVRESDEGRCVRRLRCRVDHAELPAPCPAMLINEDVSTPRLESPTASLGVCRPRLPKDAASRAESLRAASARRARRRA